MRDCQIYTVEFTRDPSARLYSSQILISRSRISDLESQISISDLRSQISFSDLRSVLVLVLGSDLFSFAFSISDLGSQSPISDLGSLILISGVGSHLSGLQKVV